MDMIQRLSRNVDERLSDASVDTDVKRWALARLDEIAVDLDRLVQADGRKQFVTSYLKEEKVKYQVDTVQELPDWIDADSTRDDPLCQCDNSDCDVKKGRIPVQIDDDELLEGIRVFEQGHPGYPAALVAAGHAYLESRGRVVRTLRRIYASLGSNEIIDRQPEADVDATGEEQSTSA